MKKINFLLAIGAILISSCKKNYTCTCTYSYSYNGATVSHNYSYTIPNATKEEANAVCKAYEVYPKDSIPTTTCNL